jgi:hypothetical protein
MCPVNSILLLHAVREEDYRAVQEICRALRNHWPGAAIAVAASSRAAWLSNLSGADEVLVMGGGWRKSLQKLRSRRFDAACLVYEAPRLPGPVALEVIALASGCSRFLALVDGRVVGLSRFRLGVRAGTGIVIAALAAAAGAAAAVIVSAFLVASALTPRRS